MKTKTNKTIKYVSKIFEEARTKGGGEIQAANGIIEAMLLELPWDRVLMSFANVAFKIHDKTEPEDHGVWLKRARVLHAAMESEKAKRLLDTEIKSRE